MTENNQIARYEFRRALEELQEAQGRGTQLISVYVGANKPISEAANYLNQEYGQASNIKSSSTRKNVQGAISSLLAELKRFGVVAPESGIALFVGHKSVGKNKTRLVKHILLPPIPVTSLIYRCDSEFFLEPLLNMLEVHDVYGLFVVDTGEYTIGLLRGEHIEYKDGKESTVPRKHGQGGQSQARFEHIHEQTANMFYEDACKAANEIFMTTDVKGILVGGPGYTKEKVLKGPWLHHELKKRVVGTFNVGYTNEHGLKELVFEARSTLRDIGLSRERDLLDGFLQQIVKDSRLVAYGEASVRNALTIGAVGTLLLSEKLRKQRATVECESCSHKEEHTTNDLDKLTEELGTCPACKANSLVVTDSMDVIEELNALAGNTGSKVELISDATDEGKQFYSNFGGMGAMLRFEVG